MPHSASGERSSDRVPLSLMGRGLSRKYSANTDVMSVGSAATRHWVDSVSDIYGPDEIEELLEDLNKLELAALEASDIQDFDIDGSQVGSSRQASANPRSARARAAATRAYRHNSTAASPTASLAESWDSHAYARPAPAPRTDFPPMPDVEAGDEHDGADLGSVITDNKGPPQLRGLSADKCAKSVRCFCDAIALFSPGNIVRILLVATSLSCLLTVMCMTTTMTAILPAAHAARLRVLMCVALFAALFALLAVVVRVAGVAKTMPIDINRVQTVVFLLLGVSFATASSLVLHVHVIVEDNSDQIEREDKDTVWERYQLAIATTLGFVCCVESFLCALHCAAPSKPSSYSKASSASGVGPVQESSTHFTLHETTTAQNNKDVAEKQQKQQPAVASEVNSRPKQPPAKETADKKSVSASHNPRKPDAKQTNHKCASASSPITPNAPPSTKSGSAEASSAKGSKSTAPAHSTGAIPKQRAPPKGPAVANHLLDEITSVPLDDDGATAAAPANRHKVKHSVQKQQQ